VYLEIRFEITKISSVALDKLLCFIAVIFLMLSSCNDGDDNDSIIIIESSG
jgi:hypothetical protein